MFKKIKVPVNNETTEVAVLKTWSVKWCCYYEEFHIDTYKEFFTDKTKAEEFKKALENAKTLLKVWVGYIELKEE